MGYDRLTRLRAASILPLLPGLGLTAGVAAAGFLAATAVPQLSSLIWAILGGIAVATAFPIGSRLQPGIRVAARQVLRIGVALLGLRLGVRQVVAVGLPALVIGIVVVPTVVGVTLWVGRRLRVRPGLALLIGTGSAICGASAIAAVEAVADTEDEDAGFAVATVTLFGTIALFLLPLADRTLLHLSPVAYGTLAGASVHEVAQVVAAASPLGVAAVKVATVVKLTRVLLLAPFVVIVGLARGRRSRSRQGPVPLFVAAFVACVVIASSGLLPARLLGAANWLDALLLTLALAGLGLGVRLREVIALGWRPIILGLGAWLVATAVALLGATTLAR